MPLSHTLALIVVLRLEKKEQILRVRNSNDFCSRRTNYVDALRELSHTKRGGHWKFLQFPHWADNVPDKLACASDLTALGSSRIVFLFHRQSSSNAGIARNALGIE